MKEYKASSITILEKFNYQTGYNEYITYYKGYSNIQAFPSEIIGFTVITGDGNPYAIVHCKNDENVLRFNIYSARIV